MKHERLLFLICTCTVFFSALSCSKEDGASSYGRDDGPSVFTGVDGIPGRLRIKTDERLAALLESRSDSNGTVKATGVKSSDDILSGLAVKSMKRTFPYAGKFEARTRAEGLHLWWDITFDTAVPLTKAENGISGIEGVEIIERIPRISLPEHTAIQVAADDAASAGTKASARSVFNDPLLSEQWHYYNDGLSYGEPGCDINVLPAWEDGITGSPEVIVSIVDQGVDYDHEDLWENMWINEAEMNGEPGVDDDGNGYVDDIYGYDFLDDTGLITPGDHGTHVAGTISAVNNNDIGVCGIAGGDKRNGQAGVRLMSCQIFKSEESEAVVNPASIKYGADNGAVISQNSWGHQSNGIQPISKSLKDAIDYFIKYAGIDENGNQTGPMRGGIVICGAGNNDQSTLFYPAGYAPTISVSAVAADFEKAYYSNFGTWCDIAAPGGDANKEHYIVSTGTDDTYIGYQGTSMACPHVSGIAALLVSQYGGPGFTNKQLEDLLISYANPAIYLYGNNENYSDMLGAGLAQAVKRDIELLPPEQVTDLTASLEGIAQIVLHWTMPEDKDDSRPEYYTIYYSDKAFDPEDIDSGNLPEGMESINAAYTGLPGKECEYIFPRMEYETEYHFSIVSTDIWGNASRASETAVCTTGKEWPPELLSEIPDITLYGPGDSTSFDLADYIIDRNDEELKFYCSTLFVIADISVEGSIFKAKALTEGSTDVKILVRDKSMNELSTQFKMTVLPPRPPVEEYSCYPNPVADILNILIPDSVSGRITIGLESGSGTRVLSSDCEITENSNTVTLDMAGIETGNYLLTISQNGHVAATFDIFKI